jgi:hypothetical protein
MQWGHCSRVGSGLQVDTWAAAVSGGMGLLVGGSCWSCADSICKHVQICYSGSYFSTQMVILQVWDPTNSNHDQGLICALSSFSSLVIRDLTLRSAASFGSFHLLRLLYDEYMFYLIENRVAQMTGVVPISVIGKVSWFFERISEHPTNLSTVYRKQTIAYHWSRPVTMLMSTCQNLRIIMD